MSSLSSIVDKLANWLAANTKSFGYLLPDTLELLLCLLLAAHFTVRLAQQQV